LNTFKPVPEKAASQRQTAWNSEPAVQMAEKDKDMPVFYSNRQTVAATNNNPTISQNNSQPSDTRRHTTAPWENSQPNTFNRGRQPPPNILPLRAMEPNEPPIYASVQRFGRRTVNIEPINVPSPMNHTTGAVGTGQFSPSYSSPKSFSKPEQTQEKLPARESPIGLAAKPGGYSQDYSIRSRPQTVRPPVPRLDHFPSSESEAYSDMSHILPRLAVVMNQPPPQQTPPLPPPVPVTAPPATKNFERQSATAFPPTPMARAPSKDTPTPAGVKTPELSRPKTFPPPPPPPRQFRNNTADEDDEYDDDSDNWDNYDDFEFTPPGTSFA
jgi:hypothetical protein